MADGALGVKMGKFNFIETGIKDLYTPHYHFIFSIIVFISSILPVAILNSISIFL